MGISCPSDFEAFSNRRVHKAETMPTTTYKAARRHVQPVHKRCCRRCIGLPQTALPFFFDLFGRRNVQVGYYQKNLWHLGNLWRQAVGWILNDQGTKSASSRLGSRGMVVVRMVPKGTTHMVAWNLDT